MANVLMFVVMSMASICLASTASCAIEPGNTGCESVTEDQLLLQAGSSIVMSLIESEQRQSCEPGQFLSPESKGDSETTCEQCPCGKYTDSSTATECYDCSPGVEFPRCDDTSCPQGSEGSDTDSASACTNTDNGATDSYDTGCDGYRADPSYCAYDTGDTVSFSAANMCCACGGGITADSSNARSVALPGHGSSAVDTINSDAPDAVDTVNSTTSVSVGEDAGGCEPGQFLSLESNNDSDRTCEQCPCGKYTDSATATECYDCSPGVEFPRCDDTSCPQGSEGSDTDSASACTDTDNGATDSYDTGCDGYRADQSYCAYDTGDTASFSAANMCCACGGGITADFTARSAVSPGNAVISTEDYSGADTAKNSEVGNSEDGSSNDGNSEGTEATTTEEMTTTEEPTTTEEVTTTEETTLTEEATTTEEAALRTSVSDSDSEDADGDAVPDNAGRRRRRRRKASKK